jgi:hypothetical protein
MRSREGFDALHRWFVVWDESVLEEFCGTNEAVAFQVDSKMIMGPLI